MLETTPCVTLLKERKSKLCVASTHKLQQMVVLLRDPSIAAGCILLLGKSGAGISTLVRHLHEAGVSTRVRYHYEMLSMPTASIVLQWQAEKITRNGISIEAITNNFGTLVHGEAKQLKKLIGERAHILVYCLSVAPASSFQTDPSLSSLQAQFGEKIWEHCVIVFTFSNLTLEYLLEKHGRHRATVLYKERLMKCASLFSEELKRLGVTYKVKPVFDGGLECQPGTIPAIPAGYKPDNLVLPDFKHTNFKSPITGQVITIKDWRDVIFTQCILNIKHYSGENLAIQSAGVGEPSPRSGREGTKMQCQHMSTAIPTLTRPLLPIFA